MSDNKKPTIQECIEFIGEWGIVLDEEEKTLEMTISQKDLAMLTEIKGIVEGEKILRKLLWLRHGCSFPALYGDDGQMDCNFCMIDFKDTPAEDIQKRFEHIGMERFKAEQQPQPGEGELVEKIIALSAKHIRADGAIIDNVLKAEIRKLLSRPSVTNLEIDNFANHLEILIKDGCSINVAIRGMFQSKGIPVIEKQINLKEK